MRVCFLASETARSIAYAQSLKANNIEIDTALFFKDDNQTDSRTAEVSLINSLEYKGIILPDLSIPLTETLSEISRSLVYCNTSDVNSIDIQNAVKSIKPELIIYSGYGGQIVKDGLLGLNIPILHIHSGSLPHFSGSTTIYFEIIERSRCAATAIIINNIIDAGDIVELLVPLPTKGINVDYIYDPAIRADLLCKVLKRIRSTKMLEGCMQEQKYQNYFVIHPILKSLHLKVR